MSDLQMLLEYGYEKERAELALKNSGNLQGALDWLEKHEAESTENLKAAEAKPATTTEVTDDGEEKEPALKEGEVAQSLVCNGCGRRLRSTAAAEWHASKTGHQDFSESTEEIAPLTEEEKKEKLAELRAKAQAKRAAQADIDREDAKKNEKIRQKSTQEIQHIKEELEKKERIKDAQKKKQEKLDDIAAKKRIQDRIAADKEERRLKAAREKADRAGVALPEPPTPAAAPAASASSSAAKTATEARLRLQTASGNVMKTVPVETTLFEVAQMLEQEQDSPVASFTLTYPKKVFEGAIDFAKTVKEAGWAPSAVVIVK